MKKQSNTEILSDAHRNFAPGLSQYAHFRIHDAAISDDLVQGAFMKAWIYMEKTGKIELMRAFLYHVLRDLIIDEYRRTKTILLDPLEENFDAEEIAPTENFFDFVDADALALLMAKLSPKYRAIIMMRYGEDLSLKEMSLRTNETENNMAVQVHRGLAKLRSLSLQPIR